MFGVKSYRRENLPPICKDRVSLTAICPRHQEKTLRHNKTNSINCQETPGIKLKPKTHKRHIVG